LLVRIVRPSRPHFLAILVLFWTLGFHGVSAAPNDIDTRVQIVGEEIRTDVSFFVRAPQQQVWDVVTDYDRAAQIFRDLRSSKVVARSGDTLRVLQKDQLRYGPFSFAFETLRQVRLIEPVRTESHLISGSMKRYDSTMELVPERDGTRIVYRSLSIPPPHVFAFIGEATLKRETEERFRQLRAAILRTQQVAATE
jgi:hypothetical protein